MNPRIPNSDSIKAPKNYWAWLEWVCVRDVETIRKNKKRRIAWLRKNKR